MLPTQFSKQIFGHSAGELIGPAPSQTVPISFKEVSSQRSVMDFGVWFARWMFSWISWALFPWKKRSRKNPPGECLTPLMLTPGG